MPSRAFQIMDFVADKVKHFLKFCSDSCDPNISVNVEYTPHCVRPTARRVNLFRFGRRGHQSVVKLFQHCAVSCMREAGYASLPLPECGNTSGGSFSAVQAPNPVKICSFESVRRDQRTSTSVLSIAICSCLNYS